MQYCCTIVFFFHVPKFDEQETHIRVIEHMITTKHLKLRGMFEMNCLFLSGDFKFQVSPKVLISCPRSTLRG